MEWVVVVFVLHPLKGGKYSSFTAKVQLLDAAGHELASRLWEMMTGDVRKEDPNPETLLQMRVARGATPAFVSINDKRLDVRGVATVSGEAAQDHFQPLADNDPLLEAIRLTNTKVLARDTPDCEIDVQSNADGGRYFVVSCPFGNLKTDLQSDARRLGYQDREKVAIRLDPPAWTPKVVPR